MSRKVNWRVTALKLRDIAMDYGRDSVKQHDAGLHHEATASRTAHAVLLGIATAIESGLE